jgi:Tol biopolymer transport system component
MEVGWYDRGGRLIEKLFDDVSIETVALSPDDSRVVMMKWDAKKGANDVYVYDIARGIRTKLTGGLANHSNPIWAPPGDRVFFDGDGDGMYDVYARADDGASSARVVWKGGDDKHPDAISPDGRWLLAQQYSAKTKDDIWLVPLDATEKASPLIATDETDTGAKFSPDGKWIAYVSAQSGRNEVYVRGFPEGRSLQVSVDGGDGARWSPDGSEIYFLSRTNDVMAAPVHLAGTLPQPGKPAALFHVPNAMVSFAPSHKAGRFIGVVRTAPEESIKVINYMSGWMEKLEQ